MQCVGRELSALQLHKMVMFVAQVLYCLQVVKEAVREATGRSARPVDPREAAKGRLDQV